MATADTCPDRDEAVVYLRDLAHHFEVRDWDYTRVTDVRHIRVVGDYSGYDRPDRRVVRAAQALFGPRTGVWRGRREGTRAQRFVAAVRFRCELALVHLRTDPHTPDGSLDDGSVITFWEETGEYLQMVQPTVGALLADFLLAEPDHPHAVLIRAELDRLLARYTARAAAGQVTGKPEPDDEDD